MDVEKFVCTDQTHMVNVRKVTAVDAGKGIFRARDYSDVDGLITNEPGLGASRLLCGLRTALFVDPVDLAPSA